MKKHSPAPWKIADYGPGIHQRYLVSSNNTVIGRVYGQSLIDDEGQANVKLIAAAPELLEALENIIDSFHESVIANPDDFPSIKMAMAAVNKATKGQV